MELDTLLARGCHLWDDKTGALSVPIYQSATFRHPAVGQSTGYDYSRVSNPTREELEKVMALLEEGTSCLAWASGMGAITGVFSLFPSGSHIILSEDLYGGIIRLCEEYLGNLNISFTYVDTSDLSAIQKAITPQTSALFLETPSNPMMRISDIQGAANVIHKAGGLLIVDNTFLTPLLQRPLTLSADIVVHSGTKYLGGHNDVLCGFTVVKDSSLKERLEMAYKTIGSVLSPHDSWLMLRSLKTLSLRLQRQQENALGLAQWLQKQPIVEKVLFPGLPEHPGYALQQKQARGSGAMISFLVKTPEAVETILNRLQLIAYAESLGGVETLMTYPLLQTHAAVPAELMKRTGLNNRLLRLSTGIEGLSDLIQDLQQAMG